jgi:hypothetical protein
MGLAAAGQAEAENVVGALEEVAAGELVVLLITARGRRAR